MASLGRVRIWRWLGVFGSALSVAAACSGKNTTNAPAFGDAGAAADDAGESGAGATSAGPSGHAGAPGALGGANGEADGGADARGGAAQGGSGETGALPGGVPLGGPCEQNADCHAGLSCITETMTVLGTGAPPHGLCSARCQTDEACQELGAGAICYPFADALDGYCIEGCSFGEPPLGLSKCGGRPDFACMPAFLGSTNVPCELGCESDELCVGGSCAIVFPGCLPSCRGDLDCAEGLHCDQSFLSGVCVPQQRTGKALGEPCTVPDANESDECVGFCQADAADSAQGHCSATCGLLSECGWNAETGAFDGACLYPSALTADQGGAGDFGFCTPSCNCSEECGDPTLACSLLDQGVLGEQFRGRGLCFTADSSTEEYEHCEAAGGAPGGFGGAPNGSAGEAASSGAGGI